MSLSNYKMTPGDPSVVANLRRQHGDALANFEDKDIAQAWIWLITSDDADKRDDTATLVEYCASARNGELNIR